MSESRFIATEPTGQPGEKAENVVWDAVRKAFKEKAEQEKCLAYWQYPLFPPKNKKVVKKPDIVIADQEFGLIVIEVKGINIGDLDTIQGHKWIMKEGFYSPYIEPYKQADQQLGFLITHTNNHDSLWKKVSGRAIVALPWITTKEWQEKNFTQIASEVPIIFKDQLSPSSWGVDFGEKEGIKYQAESL